MFRISSSNASIAKICNRDLSRNQQNCFTFRILYSTLIQLTCCNRTFLKRKEDLCHLIKSVIDICNLHPKREEKLSLDAELMCHVVVTPGAVCNCRLDFNSLNNTCMRALPLQSSQLWRMMVLNAINPQQKSQYKYVINQLV